MKQILFWTGYVGRWVGKVAFSLKREGAMGRGYSKQMDKQRHKLECKGRSTKGMDGELGRDQCGGRESER